MKAFRFKNKQQTSSYTIYTLIAVVLSIFILSNMDIYINKPVAYLLVSVLSSVSLLAAIKKASKEFEEIAFQENNIKFYFQNKMKQPLSFKKLEVSTVILDDTIEFTDIKLDKLIGKAHKIKLEEGYDWNELLKYIGR